MRNHGRTTGTNDDSFRRLEVSTGVGRRRRWTAEDKAWIVAESLDPATTAAAVARRYGLHAIRFRQSQSVALVRAMVDHVPAPYPSPPPPERTGLLHELRQDKAIYMAALKAAKTIGEETLKALPGGLILLGLVAGFEHLAEDAENAELSDRVDRLLDIGQQTQDDIAALAALAALMVSQQAMLLERMQEIGITAEPRRLDEAARAAALTAYRGRWTCPLRVEG